MKRVSRKLTIFDVLSWADAHHERTGQWPTCLSGNVRDSSGLQWSAVDSALSHGYLGLRGGTSLSKLLARHRGVRPGRKPSRLTITKILTWADEHRRRTGKWPTHLSGPIKGTKELNWRKVNNALSLGLRGLPGSSSIARLLAERRGKRNKKNVPPLTFRQILAWADAHHERNGCWPTANSGPVPKSKGETWSGINGALNQGTRGLAGDDSLARLLSRKRDVRNRRSLAPLTIKQILIWVDEYVELHGNWPHSKRGPIPGSSGETWTSVDKALRRGRRGLRGGSSLYALLETHRRYRW